MTGRVAATGPPSVVDTARQRAAPAIDESVSIGRKGLVNAVTPPAGALGVWEGPPSMV